MGQACLAIRCGTSMPFCTTIFKSSVAATSNAGALDHEALINGSPQTIVRNDTGAFQLFRIGDAVSARNRHAAIYDALRLMKDI